MIFFFFFTVSLNSASNYLTENLVFVFIMEIGFLVFLSCVLIQFGCYIVTRLRE